MALLLLGILLFLGVHLARVIKPDLRETVIARYGKAAWGAGHGILSLVGLVLLCLGFVQARDAGGAILYTPPAFFSHITLLLMVFASVCLAAGFFPAGRIKVALKFPFLVAVKIWALSHLLANGESYTVVLFVAFLAWAVIVRISAKKRLQRGEATLPVFVSAKYDVYAIVLGLVFYGLMVWRLHEWLIGVSPLTMG